MPRFLGLRSVAATLYLLLGTVLIVGVHAAPPMGLPFAGALTPTATSTTTANASATTTPTTAASASATATPTATASPSPTPTDCLLYFFDVPPDDPFYLYIRCLACRGIL